MNDPNECIFFLKDIFNIYNQFLSSFNLNKLSKLMASKFVNQIYRLLDHQRIKKKLRFNPFFLGIFPLAWPHTSSTIRSFDFEAPFEVSTFLKWNTFFHFLSWEKKMDKLTLSSVLASIPLMGYVFFPWYVPCTTGANIFLKRISIFTDLWCHEIFPRFPILFPMWKRYKS